MRYVVYGFDISFIHAVIKTVSFELSFRYCVIVLKQNIGLIEQFL